MGSRSRSEVGRERLSILWDCLSGVPPTTCHGVGVPSVLRGQEVGEIKTVDGARRCDHSTVEDFLVRTRSRVCSVAYGGVRNYLSENLPSDGSVMGFRRAKKILMPILADRECRARFLDRSEWQAFTRSVLRRAAGYPMTGENKALLIERICLAFAPYQPRCPYGVELGSSHDAHLILQEMGQGE